MEPYSGKKRIGENGGVIDTVNTVSISPWEVLSPEILSLIFVRIPAEDLIQFVQLVCKSWKEVISGPYCWTQIDIESWCRTWDDYSLIEKAVIDLVSRSDGTCTSFSAFKLNEDAFAFICQRLKCLKVLKIPESHVDDDMLIENVESLKQLTLLDISSCEGITCKGLEALGRNCSFLVELKRNIPAPWWITPVMDEGEALVIADTMTSLEHLELKDGRFTDFGLDAILTKCKKLTHLDISDSSHVKLESDDVRDKLKRLVVFMPPPISLTGNFLFSYEDEGEEYFSDFCLDSGSEEDLYGPGLPDCTGRYFV